jgi:hypothetical protein
MIGQIAFLKNIAIFSLCILQRNVPTKDDMVLWEPD